MRYRKLSLLTHYILLFRMDLSATSKVSFSRAKSTVEAVDCIVELLEHDISFYSRVMIDKGTL